MTRKAARKKLKDHLIKRGTQGNFNITPALTLYWWRILNKAIFDNILNPPKSIIVKSYRDAWGYCTIEGNYSKKVPITIEINEDIHDREFFIEILAHEMVHQWQQQNLGRMTHGTSFFSWAPKLRLLKISLEK